MGNGKGFGDLGNAFKLAAELVDVVGRAGEEKKQRAQRVDVDVFGSTKASCLTCRDTMKVGEPGHEVPCPRCVVEQAPCPTCKGKGKLGAKGHEVACPACHGKGV
jgi:hypothetical protein